MFLVSDKIEDRHQYISTFIENGDIAVAILLATADFERSAKRATLALGNSPSKKIKSLLERREYWGLDGLKRLWNEEVFPYRRMKLADDVVTNWSLVKEAFKTRNRLIHGGAGKVHPERGLNDARQIIAASAAIHAFAREQGFDLDARIDRRRPRSLVVLDSEIPEPRQ